MTDEATSSEPSADEQGELLKNIEEELQVTDKLKHLSPLKRWIVTGLLFGWAVFQLLLPKVLLLDQVQIRPIHLAFAMALALLTLPFFKKGSRLQLLSSNKWMSWLCYVMAGTGGVAALYVMIFRIELSKRPGLPTTADIWFGIILIVLLLEATRRVVGPAMTIICMAFTAYAFLGPHMPTMFAYRGVDISKYLGKVALSDAGIYGLPLDVSANTVFLYVLFGAMLARVGAGHFFNELSISLLGRFKGGPAKAAVVSSGLTGMVSGSSIANVVTTGTFTIPLMKRVGYPAKIAAATEVAASTNGQLMPPIMGAAAFVIAEYLGIDYLEVIKAAAIPAIVSYIALFYITHLEACKLGMKGLPAKDIPRFMTVIKSGFHYLLPLAILLYELIWKRHTPKLAAFNAILALVVVVIVKNLQTSLKERKGFWHGFKTSCKQLFSGMLDGSWNMLSVALATAAAGIVIGVVTTGMGSMLIQVIETLSRGNIFLLLLITAFASLVLGMGLPTTATYIVMATVTVPAIVTLGNQFAFNPIPAIAAHLFCFYFGILADDTPPVGLAAYAAAAIAGSKPIPTGIQGFIYDLRTAVIPFMFIFNPDLLLYNITSPWQIGLIFVTATVGALAFTNAVQGWFVIKNKLYDIPLFLTASLLFFCPRIITRFVTVEHYVSYVIALGLYGIAFQLQRARKLAMERNA